MHRFILLGALVLTAGCQSVVGPFQSRQPERVDDPRFTIAEQQRRGRDRLALPDDTGAVGPPAGILRPGGPQTSVQTPGLFSR